MNYVRVAAVAALLLLLASCYGPQKATYRYRITVSLNTPEGLVQGSSVWEITSQRYYNPLATGTCGNGRSTRQYRSTMRGDAVQIRLPDGREMYALRATYGGKLPDRIAMQTLSYHWSSTETCPDWGEEMARRRAFREYGTIALRRMPHSKPYGVPMLAVLGNDDDPRGLTVLDPDNLSTDFGDGYSLESVTFEPTTDPPTLGLVRTLSWLRNPGPIEPYVISPLFPKSKETYLKTSLFAAPEPNPEGLVGYW